MKMLSNRDACNWCGRVIDLLEGKGYCEDCWHCCVHECRTCHKPYPSLKYFPNSDCERCNCCTKHATNEKQKRKKGKYTKNKVIAMSMKNRKRRDEEVRGEHSTTPSPLPPKKKRRANPPVNDISDTASSSYSVSDNESVEDVDLLGEEGNNKTSDYSDNEQEEEMMKKSRQKNRDNNNRTVSEMLKAVEDKKKRTELKNPDAPIQQKKKRAYNRRSNTEKTPAQAEKDLINALINYKKALTVNAQINVVFVPE